ncbi:MAG: IclR family transcriptional regulator C-terminal domain-containing protein [Victivallaceae bacterium]|nr:IclR family transcriptional regulator C-terminal domain-containing protein [Victivallaceae bacterium]
MSKVPALQRGLEIVRIVAKGNYTLPQLEAELEIPKASFGRLIKCLSDNGFIDIEEGTKLLSAGDELIFIAMESYENSVVWREGNRSVRELSERWGVTFVIHEYREPFRIYWRVKSVPTNGINTKPAGFYMQGLNCNSQGQLFLSQLPELTVKDFFAFKLIRVTSEHTLKSYDELKPRLEEIRSNGYAYQERENNPFMKQISVPLKLQGSNGKFCLTCYLPLDFKDVEPLRDSMLFEAARVGGTE